MLIELNKGITECLSKTELEIVRFINENEERMSELSIVEIAFDTFSSPSTVSRAIRKCGLNGFHELRYRLTVKAEEKDIQNMGEVMNKSLVEAQQVIEHISVSGILEIIKCIKEASRIFVFGRGLTEYVAEEFALKLQLLDYNAMAVRDPNIMRNKTKRLRADEVIFNFSLNGMTEELIESSKNANLCGAKVLTCCCNDQSPLLELSACSLVGFRHSHKAIKDFEVSSRVPLQIMARLIIDYLTSYE
ncbi:hypothetical protein C806_00172 [Lachnospiraceae bacterium 3-1]|nr:hypothetical protein C806_00172 [Lachnospiraceae bacterium 3-1]